MHCSWETMQVRRQWDNINVVIEKKKEKYQYRILYTVRISLKNKNNDSLRNKNNDCLRKIKIMTA